MLKRIFAGGIASSPYSDYWELARPGYREFHPWGGRRGG
jgi:hypothetical protein